ncbi:hypothetical protein YASMINEVIRUS_397 [Yasminevirus sp. GU-2018]|uniref:Uncharacterized protein n=1 Tax=Yasminevirus sp. GU-2018 TaxID=2420051 RepID=A0A5K0U8X3_9VIRU|nr:hypothetical protein YASMINEVIRUS_397 [Yasminevirus sp. GU-2018]
MTDKNPKYESKSIKSKSDVAEDRQTIRQEQRNNKESGEPTVANEDINFPRTSKLERTRSTYHDDGTDRAFIDYDPKRDTRPYPVYRNDIKFRKHREVNPSRAIWTEDVASDFHNKDTDSIDYRIEECIREKYEMIDLSHMESDCFVNMMRHKAFPILCTKLQHIFAKDCNLEEVPDLTCFKALLTLDLSSNKLSELPKLPKTLEELIVNNNKLTSIKHDLPKLLRFNGADNNISVFNYSPTLERIHLKNNPISYVPQLDNIYFLDIATTRITQLHPCKNLKWLDVSYTQIEALPEMDSLQHLSCNESNLKDISKLKNLHTMEMVRSQIERVPYFKDLFTMVYEFGSKFALSKHYSIKHVKKNKRDIVEITFLCK